MDDLMPIGEFSERSGLSPKRLRTYASGGLLVPAAVDAATGYRYYSAAQLRPAQLIDTLRQAGVPLADIGAFLRDPSGRQIEAWARRVEDEATQSRQALEVAWRLASHLTMRPGETDHVGEMPMTTFRTASRTAVGPVRARNEDAVSSCEHLVAIADGMGGQPGGALASTIAVGLVEAAFTGRSLDELHAGVRAANRAIWDRAGADPGLEGMGTTICAAGLVPGSLVVVNVGDSRAYLVHEGSLTQLTDDHSVTAELVRSGQLGATEARSHPYYGVLTRALGVGPTVEADDTMCPAVPGDRVLLCSDGLYNELSHEEIERAMTADRDEAATAEGLVDLAVSRGGRDNVSVVVATLGP